MEGESTGSDAGSKPASVCCRPPPLGLRRRPLPLRFEPSPLGALRGLRRAALRAGWREAFADQASELLERGLPIAQLRSAFRGGHREHPVDEALLETLQEHPPPVVGETCDSPMFQESSTRLSVVLTCCPPGPEDRENRQPSSAAGIVSERDTSKSMCQALHAPQHAEVARRADGTQNNHRHLPDFRRWRWSSADSPSGCRGVAQR